MKYQHLSFEPVNGCPFHPENLLRRIERVNGIELLNVSDEVITNALNETCAEYSDWEEGQGFGSSDGTFALKSFIDNAIMFAKLNLTTVFSPCLTITNK